MLGHKSKHSFLFVVKQTNKQNHPFLVFNMHRHFYGSALFGPEHPGLACSSVVGYLLGMCKALGLIPSPENNFQSISGYRFDYKILPSHEFSKHTMEYVRGVLCIIQFISQKKHHKLQVMMPEKVYIV